MTPQPDSAFCDYVDITTPPGPRLEGSGVSGLVERSPRLPLHSCPDTALGVPAPTQGSPHPTGLSPALVASSAVAPSPPMWILPPERAA